MKTLLNLNKINFLNSVILFVIITLPVLSSAQKTSEDFIISENTGLVEMEHIISDSILNTLNPDNETYYVLVENRGEHSELLIYEMCDIQPIKSQRYNINTSTFIEGKIKTSSPVLSGFFQIYAPNPEQHTYFKIISFYKGKDLISRLVFYGVERSNNKLPFFENIKPHIDFLKYVETIGNVTN